MGTQGNFEDDYADRSYLISKLDDRQQPDRAISHTRRTTRDHAVAPMRKLLNLNSPFFLLTIGTQFCIINL
ncbi:MAG: hypothetical protein GF353_30015 [Candidatus Lokiarchaeota archaeon]|nr:hypothetical protein [Candidatus Lokiarchaeota archaeon]